MTTTLEDKNTGLHSDEGWNAHLRQLIETAFKSSPKWKQELTAQLFDVEELFDKLTVHQIYSVNTTHEGTGVSLHPLHASN